MEKVGKVEAAVLLTILNGKLPKLMWERSGEQELLVCPTF